MSSRTITICRLCHASRVAEETLGEAAEAGAVGAIAGVAVGAAVVVAVVATALYRSNPSCGCYGDDTPLSRAVHP